METLPRTGIVMQQLLDPVHAVDYFYAIGETFEIIGALFGQGTLGDRPTAGKAGRFWKVPGDTVPRIYYDDGTTWVEIGVAAPPVDPAQDVPGLRTLGEGHQQAAPGDHHHPMSEIDGLETALNDIRQAISNLEVRLIMGVYDAAVTDHQRPDDRWHWH